VLINFTTQSSPEDHRIYTSHRIEFDRVIINKLEKYRSHRGFGWSICSLRYFVASKTRDSLISYLASMLIVRQMEGNEDFFEDMGFSGLFETYSITSAIEPRGIEYLEYLYDLLEKPERSGAYALNSQMFASAVRECLDLYLCNPRLLQRRQSSLIDGIPRCIGRLHGYGGCDLGLAPFAIKSAQGERRGRSTYAAGSNCFSWGRRLSASTI